jgi:hypothetical protein
MPVKYNRLDKIVVLGLSRPDIRRHDAGKLPASLSRDALPPVINDRVPARKC